MPYYIDEEHSDILFEVNGDQVAFKESNPGSGGGSGEMPMYVIKEKDSTTPTDRNLFSSKRVLAEIAKGSQTLHDEYISKKKPDRTPHLLSSDKGFEVGEFVTGESGGKVWLDEETLKVLLELDRIVARKSIDIGDARLEYDEQNRAIRVCHRKSGGEEEMPAIGIYAEGFVSAKGASSGGQGGGGGASALYGLNDVLKNEAGDGVMGAAVGKVLMFNGTHWYAGDAKGKVVSIKVGETNYAPDNDGLISLPEYAKVVDKTITVEKFIGALQGNADTATKLSTARTLWGQSFDGTANVSGAMTGVTSITIGDCVISYDSTNKGLKFSTGIYSEQYVSAKGANSESGSGGGGVGSIYVGNSQYNADSEGVVRLPAYPTIPTSLKNPYALTIKRNSVVVDSYDGSLAKTVNIDVPTKVSELTNDSKYLVTGNLVQGTNISITTDTTTGNVTIENTYSYTHPTNGANTTIAAASGKVLSSITVNNLGHVTTVGYKTLAAADIPTLTISKISGLQSSLDSKLNASVFNDLFEKVVLSDGTTAIRAKYGFYSDSFVSAKGSNSESGGSGGGGIGSIYVGSTQYNADSEGIVRLPAYPTIPTSLKNPYALTIQANGTSLGTYDGSAANTVNLTYSNVGAAPSSHASDTTLHITSAERANWNNALRGRGGISGSDTPTASDYTSVGAMCGCWNAGNNTNYGNLIQFYSGGGGSTNYIQFWSRYNTGMMWRNSTESTLSSHEWRTLIDSVNYNNYAPSLNGSGAYGTWGISVTGNAATATKLKNYYTSRPSNANLSPDGSGGMCKFLATSTMTSNKPIADGHILHLHWDDTNGWDSQLYIPNDGSKSLSPQWRAQYNGNWRSWVSFVTSETIGNYNAGSATKLQTPRTLWGQKFDGSANVDGSLHIFSTGGSWDEGIRMHVASNNWCSIVMCGTDNTGSSGTSANTWSIHNNNGTFYINRNGSSGTTPYILCNINGNWGIGTNSPSVKLHVVGDIAATGAITAKASSSDIRLKRDLTEYDALSIVRSHRSVKYHWNMTAKKNSAIFDDDEWHYGLIAQELQREHPQLVKDVFGDYLTIDYERLIPILWRAVQQLEKRNEELEVKLNEERR